ncbi:hypothetical protein GFB69_12540 [Acidianus ambivalens]|uniref:Uncharacterized protein n=1 Tax=Acidianus ambivalens TaxID=2283 RepID=A0A650CTJ2_ACIAM|nr:hypothetical protein [Acidianus ambivalens]QGR21126.1 hypothetical protein D1866_03195 [Acidianus ambivalens]
MEYMNPRFLKQGNYVSLIASLIILFGLIYLEIEGISYALSSTFLILMWIVWLLALSSFTEKGVKGAESLASLRRGWIAPLYLNTSLSKFSFDG